MLKLIGKGMNYTLENKVPGNNLEEQQAAILANCPALRLHDNYVHSSGRDLANFVQKFLENFSRMYETKKVLTGEHWCTTGKRRSMIDIFLISRYYYPNCTLAEIREILRTCPNLGTSICSEIRRRVFWNQNGGNHNRLELEDEFGLLFTDYQAPLVPIVAQHTVTIPSPSILADEFTITLGGNNFIGGIDPIRRW